MFFECADAWGTAWEKALLRIGDFEKRLGILSITNLAVRYHSRNFKIATIRRVLFTDPLWNFLSSCSWEELGRMGDDAGIWSWGQGIPPSLKSPLVDTFG